MAEKNRKREVIVEEEEEVLGEPAPAGPAYDMSLPSWAMKWAGQQRPSGWRILGYIFLTFVLLALLSPILFAALGLFGGGGFGALLGLTILVLAIWKIVDLLRGR